MNKCTPISVDNYIAAFPTTAQELLTQMRTTMTKKAANAEEGINYGMPAHRLSGNLVYFADYKNHIGFYPGEEAVKAFIAEIAGSKYAKGLVQFPHKPGVAA